MLLSRLKDNVDQKMKYADTLMNGIASENRLQQFAADYSYGAYDTEELYSDIQSIYKPDYLVNYSVYFMGTGEVISTGIHMDIADYFQYMYKPVDMDYNTFFTKYLTGYRLRTLGPATDILITGENEVNVLPYVQTFPFYGKSLGQIIILLNTKDTVNLMSQLHELTMSSVYVLDSDNNIMLSSDDAPALTEELTGAIQKNPDATCKIQVRGQPMIVMSALSNQNGWRYVLVTPKNIYFQKNIQFAMICVAVFAVYLIIGLVIGHVLAKHNSRSISEISGIIKKYVDNGKSMDGGNELRTIKSVLLDKFSSDQKLNEIVQAQKPIVKQAYLLSLVKGLEVDYEEALERLKSLGIEFSSDNFAVIALEFDLDSPFFMEKAQFPGENYSLAHVIVQNVGNELFDKYFQSSFLDLDRNQFIFLLNAVKNVPPDKLVCYLKQSVTSIDEFAKNNFQLSIDWGISSIHKNYINLPKCYDESKKALESSKKNSVGLVCFNDMQNSEIDYFLPMEIESQIINLLKSGSYRESKELLGNIFQINENVSHGISSQASKCFLNAVVIMLVRTMNDMLSKKGKQPLPDQTLTDWFGENPTWKSAKTCCLQFIDSIAKEAQNQIIRKTELLVGDIANFIDENVEGNLLDLNYISEKFNLTPQYISNIFKKYRKENIKNYISRQKLSRAKELLENTNLSISEVSIRLGYMNELGIFRLFRKYDNITPGEYRALHKKSPDDTV